MASTTYWLDGLHSRMIVIQIRPPDTPLGTSDIVIGGLAKCSKSARFQTVNKNRKEKKMNNNDGRQRNCIHKCVARLLRDKNK